MWTFIKRKKQESRPSVPAEAAESYTPHEAAAAAGPVDVTECAGPLVGSWEFPDPVMQADADLRRRIAELEDENRRLYESVSELELTAIAWDNVQRAARLNEKNLRTMYENFAESVDRAVQIRTATLSDKLAKAEYALLQAKRRAA